MNFENEITTHLKANNIFLEDVAITIKNAIESYLSKNPHLSLRSIAEKSKSLSNEYVRRLAKGEVKSKNLDFIKVIRVLSIITNKKSTLEIIQCFNEPQYLSLQNYLKSFIGTSTLVQEFEIESLCFENESSSVVYCMASSKSGVKSETLTKTLGNNGIIAAEKLLRYKIFTKIEDTYFLKEEYRMSPSLEYCKKIAKYFLNFYKIENFGKELNFIICGYSSMNKKGILAKQELYRNLLIDLNKINNDPSYHGTTPMFDVASMDTFLPLEIDEDFDTSIKELGDDHE